MKALVDVDADARLRVHNETVLPGLMADAFTRLSLAQQQAVYRVADLFLCSAAWRRGALGHDQAVALDLDAMGGAR